MVLLARPGARCVPLGALCMLLSASAAIAASAGTQGDDASADDSSPLIRFVATLESDSPPFPSQRLDALRAAERALARTPVPGADCAQALGAARHGALHARLAGARRATGDRAGAIAALQRALDCEPRRARYHLDLADLLLASGRLDEADAQAARAARLAPREAGLNELLARLDYVAGRWSDAARRALQVAAALQRRPIDDEDEPEADSGATDASETAAFWRLLALLAQRRGGLPAQGMTTPDPTLEDRWPVPLWRLIVGQSHERTLVAAIEAQTDAARRREMACEALYYTAQAAFANGRPETGRQRLARAVNLKVLYFVEHDLALAELARLRSR